MIIFLLSAASFLLSALLLPWYVTALLVPLVAPLRYSLPLLVLGGALMDVLGSGVPLYTLVFGLAGIVAEVLRERALV